MKRRVLFDIFNISFLLYVLTLLVSIFVFLSSPEFINKIVEVQENKGMSSESIDMMRSGLELLLNNTYIRLLFAVKESIPIIITYVIFILVLWIGVGVLTEKWKPLEFWLVASQASLILSIGNVIRLILFNVSSFFAFSPLLPNQLIYKNNSSIASYFLNQIDISAVIFVIVSSLGISKLYSENRYLVILLISLVYISFIVLSYLLKVPFTISINI